MNVKFCASSAFIIQNDELKEKIFNECEKLLSIKLKRSHFPGPQPVAIERKDLDILSKGYIVCEKTDGERAVLLLINIDNKPMCFIINRNNELYFINLSFKKEVFEGTIFDGEIIKTINGSWNYLIHDCMCYNGTSFILQSHRLRYACIIDFILKRYSNKETDCFNIKTKLFYKYGPEIEKTWEHIKTTTENKIDGLIFTPIDLPIIFGRDYSLFKWKEENTMDLLVKKIENKKKLGLYGISKGVLYIVSEIKNEIIKVFTKEIIPPEGLVIEFKYQEGVYIPFRIRTDKNYPNSKITIDNTFINIEENIQIQDL